jgi:hypothetical protein
MAQFTIYSSGDASGPGAMTGTAGSVLTILDACLVNGYTGKAAAGWTKPFANSGDIGCYKNASPANSGNGFGVVINDNGPNGTSTYKEAWATGWETITSVAGPVGTGGGQFPLPAQLLTTGHVVLRKSFSADSTPRSWILFADSLTFYLFVVTGDSAGTYYSLWFGDFFSLGGSGDSFRCMIQGRASENSSISGSGVESSDTFSEISVVVVGGTFCPRTSGGGGSSVVMNKIGATCFSNANLSSSAVVNVGVLQTPNGADNAYYLPPIWLYQITVNQIRGRLRGMYHSAHPLVSWSDGQVVAGASDYAGKTLQAVSKGPSSGMWFIETSATVETN